MATRKPSTKPTKAEPTADTGIFIEAPQAGTDLATLTPEERASLVLSFDTTRAQLQVLAKSSTTLVAVDTPDNLAAAKSARAKLQAARITIEKVGKAARDETNKFNKAVIAKERELIDEISPEEQRLAELILAEQRRQEEAERVAKEEEQRRAEAITKAFARVRSLPGLAVTATVDDIDTLIAEAQQLLNDQSHLPADMQPAARYEANLAINELKAARDRRVQADKDAAELAAFRAQQAAKPVAEENQQRASTNAAEVDRAKSVLGQRQAFSPPATDVRTGAYAPDDDDLPPGHAPRGANAAFIPPKPAVTVPAQVARDCLDLLVLMGQGNHPSVKAFAQAIG